MKRPLQSMLVCLSLLATASPTLASSISLLPAELVVAPGDVVAIQVWGDFSDDPVIGGGFDILWDPAALLLEAIDVEVVGNPMFGRDPDVLPGQLESWGIGDFNGFDSIYLLGTMWFTVLPAMGSATTITPGPTTGIAGPFTDGFGFIEPDYLPATLTRIPLPPAVWLLTTGLGVLIGWGRTT